MTKCLIFAHRGANTEAAENTRSAFDRALEYPIDGIETDVQLSRDEVAVLWHDRFLGKVGLPLKHVDDFDYARLKSMDFAAHFSARAKPEGIMTLKEFLDGYRTHCRLLIEIKNREWELSCRHVIKVRQTLDMALAGNTDAGYGNTIIVSSFNLHSLIYAHQYSPGFPLVYNLEEDQFFSEAEQVLSAHSFLYGLCLPIGTLDEAMVKLLRDRGKCLAVYTCNSDAEIAKALEFGVDILISDVPQKALAMRDHRMMEK